MTVTLQLNFSPEIEDKIRSQVSHLEKDVKESLAVELFRRGTLSHFELSQILGLDRFETDAYLKRRGVFEGTMSIEDVQMDIRTLEQVLGKGGK